MDNQSFLTGFEVDNDQFHTGVHEFAHALESEGLFNHCDGMFSQMTDEQKKEFEEA